MANPEHVKILKQGVDVWNKWCKEHPEVHPDLSGANLRVMNLSGANLRIANLSEANLSGANLHKADLSRAKLSKANLNEAKLIRVNLSRADLSRANLSIADLSIAKLSKANLREADFSVANLKYADFIETKLSKANFKDADLSGANLIRADLRKTNLSFTNLSRANLAETNLEDVTISHTIFTDIDLTNTKGLDKLQAFGPSAIDHKTLIQSKNLPENFLRDCGLPDQFIEYLPSLLGSLEPIQFYSCFISHSSKDEEFAQRLHADLQAKGIRCWYAPENLKIGDEITPTIDHAIRVHEKLLLIFSENSITSAWVRKEAKEALATEKKKEKKDVLFPIRLDDSILNTTEQWADDVRRERHIGDFRKWKEHDAYQKSFERLLRDLKNEGT